MRWSVAAAGTAMISATVAPAQYRQDYYRGQIDRPGPNRGDTIYGTPRPDFPGPYQSETSVPRSHKHSTARTK
jgi:hypothetical protein